MGKKRSRKTKTSSGTHSSVSKQHNFDTWDMIDRAIFKAEARTKGKKVYMTVPNPDKNNTKERFIKVCYNG